MGKREEAFPPGTFGHLDFGLLVSRPVREYVFIILGHLVLGTLLRQPQEMNTAGNLYEKVETCRRE